MKYTLNNTTFSALAALFFAASAFCMEDESTILIPPKKSTEILLFLHSSIDFCDHFMICKIGRLNTELYNAIKKAAPDRKKYIAQNMKLKPSDPSQIMWNSCGSAYGFIEIKDQRGFGLSKYWVDVNQVYLGYNKEIKSMSLISEPTVESSISCFKRGKCNENGTMSFYYMRDHGNSPEVREFSFFSENGLAHDKHCAVSFSDSSGYCGSLYTLVSLPNLFWAFIHSSLISDDDSKSGELWKIFNLQGVTIPTGFDEKPSFEELPPNWKKAVADRYQQQQSKK